MIVSFMRANYNEGVFDTHCHLQELDDVDAGDRARAARPAWRACCSPGVGPASWQRDDALRRRARGARRLLRLASAARPHRSTTPRAIASSRALDARPAPSATRASSPSARLGSTASASDATSLARQERVLSRAARGWRAQARLPVALHVLRAASARARRSLRDEPLPRTASCTRARPRPSWRANMSRSACTSRSRARSPGTAATTKRRAPRGEVPRDRLVVETDAPDQTPEPQRPGRNEPAFLVAIVRAIAHLWGVDFAEAARITDGNARRLFGVDLMEPLDKETAYRLHRRFDRIGRLVGDAGMEQLSPRTSWSSGSAASARSPSRRWRAPASARSRSSTSIASA